MILFFWDNLSIKLDSYNMFDVLQSIGFLDRGIKKKLQICEFTNSLHKFDAIFEFINYEEVAPHGYDTSFQLSPT